MSVTGKHCLVVEDEFLISLDVQQMLDLAGAASVTCVGNAGTALVTLDRRSFDFAILDVKLGGAIESTLSLAAALEKRGTPFVFLTGIRVNDPQLARFPNAPVVAKPYEPAALMGAVRAVLRKR